LLQGQLVIIELYFCNFPTAQGNSEQEITSQSRN